MRYLIAYDIAAPDRLRRVARVLEREAIRIQKSVFVAEMTSTEMRHLLRTLSTVMDLDEDIVQAFRISPNQPLNGEAIGSVVPVNSPTVICGGGPLQFPGARP